jgi:peptide/nickel transport system ATP-binding protein/oligopeptide transport system ATP-binding protein
MSERSDPSESGNALLQVDELRMHFPVTRGVLLQRVIGQVRAVDGVTFSVNQGETFGLVGETGCGKSTTGRLIAGYLSPTAGTVTFDGNQLGRSRPHAAEPNRREIQLIAQDPYSSLNPRHQVGNILSAPFRYQKLTPPGGVKQAVLGLLDQVGLRPADYNRFPDDFSGGQRQRIVIARAIAVRPRMIVADEPVSALDVSVRAQILNLLDDLQKQYGLTYLFISHDLSVVRHIADHVAVMYLGKIVEIASRDRLYAQPRHPYTHALLSAAPIPDPRAKTRIKIRLTGEVPSPLNPPSACRFHPRCWKAQEICRTVEPKLTVDQPGHLVACHFPDVAPPGTGPGVGRAGAGLTA